MSACIWTTDRFSSPQVMSIFVRVYKTYTKRIQISLYACQMVLMYASLLKVLNQFTRGRFLNYIHGACTPTHYLIEVEGIAARRSYLYSMFSTGSHGSRSVLTILPGLLFHVRKRRTYLGYSWYSYPLSFRSDPL